TITQQLARGLFLVPDQTIQRKIQEAFIAMEIERQFTKDEILEMYLNHVYFGAGAYGIEAAARTYFGGISASELSLCQAATLVRMLKNPSGFNPERNPDRCLTQRNVALSMMAEDGYLSGSQAEDAMQAPLRVDMSRPDIEDQWDYFTEYVRQYLVSRYGWSAVYEQGLTVYTTLDPEMQGMAEYALDSVLTLKEPVWDPSSGQFLADPERLRYMSSYDYWHDAGDTTRAPDYVQGALVAVDPASGYIRAMVGGRDFRDSEFNRAAQARRQPGSAFKPFVYAEAIEQGWSPGSPVLDQPIVVDESPGYWRPRNYDHQFHGMVTLRTALARSFNVSAVRLGMAVGVEAVAERAHQMGIESRLPIVNSLSLGSAMVSPLEMVQAYVPFATGGIARGVTAILRVEDRYGNVLETNEQPDPGHRVLSQTGAYFMNSMLQSVLRMGTGTGAHWYWGGAYAGRPAGGKTGTTSDYADAWFVGFTPDLVAGVWVGYDSHIVRMRLQSGRGQSGSDIALPIWNRFMRLALRDADRTDPPGFPGPAQDSVESAIICKLTGLLATAECGEYAMEEMFWKGSAPTAYCTLHQRVTPFEADTTIPDFTEYDRLHRGGGTGPTGF
ncbi:PBP1A family penicillin-binding protein, partial [Candidatus Fermentibacterales bacterium]|nr:PBP1A family penicillin-binding protein [Candidatus Fermentibacterales bacterium]